MSANRQHERIIRRSALRDYLVRQGAAWGIDVKRIRAGVYDDLEKLVQDKATSLLLGSTRARTVGALVHKDAPLSEPETQQETPHD